MTRIITKTARGPMDIKPEDGPKSICLCGLSKSQPFCDKSHLKTLDEEEGKLYEYDEQLNREEVGHECCGGCCGDK